MIEGQPPLAGRDSGIRTHGLYHPKVARYQAAPYPVSCNETNYINIRNLMQLSILAKHSDGKKKRGFCPYRAVFLISSVMSDLHRLGGGKSIVRLLLAARIAF